MSKKAHRKQQRRRARHERVTIDFETRGHYHVGDCHVGQGHEQIMAYARGAGLTEFIVIRGGDFIYDRRPK